MLNQSILVGRLANEPTIEELENGKKITNITLAVPRSFKNDEGIYETDFIPVVLFDRIAENTLEYVHKGDVIGIHGRLQMSNEILDEIKTDNFKLKVIAEKVTFLSSKSEK